VIEKEVSMTWVAIYLYLMGSAMMWWRKFKIWWRGFTDDDLASARAKIDSSHEPGEVVWLSSREFRAWIFWHRIHERISTGMGQ